MSYKIIMWLLIVHWIADFICQRHKWAINKSTCIIALSKHVATYTALLWLFVPYDSIYSQVAVGFALINGVAHFATDYVTSRITSHLYKQQKFHAFFAVIGLDQVLHYAVLFATAGWLLK